MRSRSTFSLLLILWLYPLFSPTASAVDADVSCEALRDADSASVQLYFQTTSGEFKPLDGVRLPEIKGRPISMYLMLRRPEEVLQLRRVTGAASVKIELWQSDGGPTVYLYNNLWKSPDRNQVGSSCTMVNFERYQRSYEIGVFNECLKNFNRTRDEFSIAGSPQRLRFLLFPDGPLLTPLERPFRDEPAGPVKRLSQLYIYSTSKDAAKVCVHFNLTTSLSISALRITVNDLLDDVYNGFPPPLIAIVK